MTAKTTRDVTSDLKVDERTPDNDVIDFNAEDMADNAEMATDFLKAIAHEGRLMILCRLVEGECTVTELENLLSARQAAVSQQLARLRLEGLVGTRREGKSIYYFLADDRVKTIIPVIHRMFCASE